MPTLVFWKPRSDLKLKPAGVWQELQFGEDVEGLIDLPVKEVLDDMKLAFPNHHETPGAFAAFGAVGRFDVSWSWQFVAVKAQDLVTVDLERIRDMLRTRGCGVYEAELDQWTPPQL